MAVSTINSSGLNQAGDTVFCTTSGNVGIGTSSPDSKLAVYNATGTSQFRFGASSNYYWDISRDNDVTGNLLFSNNNATSRTTRMVIDASGNVGIGTSSPQQKFHVYNAGSVYTQVQSVNASTGAGAIYKNATANWLIGAGPASGGSEFAFVDQTNGSGNPGERMRIDSSGRLLVGTTSAPGQTGGVIVANNELFVYNIPTTASGANCNISSGESNRFYRSTSALKYKQNIRDIESIDISKFRPVRYKSKCENDDQTKDHFGIIADEVHEAGITELVSYGADGEIEGFQYDRLTVVLLKHCQEQQAIITALTARVTALENQP